MKKILILDDNFEICLLYKTLVSHMGMAVRTTTDALEALDWLDHDYFDLIMTDMRMPIMGGAEFIRLARAKGVKSKVIAITAFQNLSNANQLSHLNVYACLIKPVLLTKLEEVICAALAEAEAENAGGGGGNNPAGHTGGSSNSGAAPAATTTAAANGAAPSPAVAPSNSSGGGDPVVSGSDLRPSVPDNRVGFRTNRVVTLPAQPTRLGNGSRLTLRP